MVVHLNPCFDGHRNEVNNLEPDITPIAGLIAEPARSKMLLALMSGKALTASELADFGEITAQTASSHLKKLVNHQLVQVTKQGRHKYFLLNEETASLIEKFMVVSQELVPLIMTGPSDPRLRQARVCYDHLAGTIGVQIFETFLQKNYLTQAGEDLTPKGITFLDSFGVCLSDLENSRRKACRTCMDWSERRFHLAGTLGKLLLSHFLEKGWMKRDCDSRALHLSTQGKDILWTHFKISCAKPDLSL